MHIDHGVLYHMYGSKTPNEHRSICRQCLRKLWADRPSSSSSRKRSARSLPINRPVLLTGERGTGKELAAARLHYLSKRWSGPFIRWNCAACPPELVESELFGHEAGAFTGALKRRPGRFEMSDGGTLIPGRTRADAVAVQEKLLSVIEYGVFERVGGNESLQVDVRIVAQRMQTWKSHARKGSSAPTCSIGSHAAWSRCHLSGSGGKISFAGAILHRANGSGAGAEHNAGAGCETEAELLGARLARKHPRIRNVVERAVIHAVGGKLARLELKPLAGRQSPPKAEKSRKHGREHWRSSPCPLTCTITWRKCAAVLLERALQRPGTTSGGRQRSWACATINSAPCIAGSIRRRIPP